MKLKTLCFIGIIFFAHFSARAQDKMFKIGLQTGSYLAINTELDSNNSGDDVIKVMPGYFYGFETSYFFNKHFFVASEAIFGVNRYVSKIEPAEFIATYSQYVYPNGSNADLKTAHLSISAGYSVPIFQKFSVSGQIGISGYIELKTYAAPDYYFKQYAYRYHNFTSLAFPVKLSVNYAINNKIDIGLIGGCYIEPDYPLIGYHVGPQLNFRF